jgi:hypothetical protein
MVQSTPRLSEDSAPAVAAVVTVAVPGWRVDPTQRHAYRYHDGANWTIYIADANATGTDDPYPGQTPPDFPVGPPLAGWWSDPWRLHRSRYHDGNQWTTTVNDADPVFGPGPGDGKPEKTVRDGLSPGALGLAVLASVVGTVLIAKLGTSQGATLAGAAVSPMIAGLFTTRRKGLAGRLRAGAVALLTLAAVGFTVLGFTATESATGKSLINGDQSTTFPVPDGNTTPGGGPGATPGGEPDPTAVTLFNAGNEVTELPICPGATENLDAHVTYSDGTDEDDPPEVDWLYDETVVTVDGDGVVTVSEFAVSTTETTITATLGDLPPDSVVVTVC